MCQHGEHTEQGREGEREWITPLCILLRPKPDTNFCDKVEPAKELLKWDRSCCMSAKDRPRRRCPRFRYQPKGSPDLSAPPRSVADSRCSRSDPTRPTATCYLYAVCFTGSQSGQGGQRTLLHSTPSFFPFFLLTLIALFAVFIREKWSRPNLKPKALRTEIENALSMVSIRTPSSF